MPGPRTCFFHIGTHKTGSTALQNFLGANRDTLKRTGLLVPVNGWMPSSPGHRHPGALIAGRAVVNPDTPGSFAGLLDEMSSFSGDVVLSSEAVWGFSGYPSGLRRVQAAIENTGVTIEYVVYFREQKQLIASWYNELSKHGYYEEFATYLKNILWLGRFNNNDIDGVCLDFDYNRFLENFDFITGRKVHGFSYHTYARGHALIQQFLALCLPNKRFPADFFKGAEWTNHRGGAHTVRARVALNELMRRGETIAKGTENEIMRRAAERDRNRTFDPFSAEQKRLIDDTFAVSNTRLLTDWDIDLRDAPVPEGLLWREICGAEEFQIEARSQARQDIEELVGTFSWP